MELFRPASPDAHHQVCASEKHVKPIHVLGDAPVGSLAVTELPFHNQEKVLYFAADRGLTMFDPTIPAESVKVLAGRLQL